MFAEKDHFIRQLCIYNLQVAYEIIEKDLLMKLSKLPDSLCLKVLTLNFCDNLQKSQRKTTKK